MKMKVEELLALIPEEDLRFLASETKVDHHAKKLDGISLFRLLLFSMLQSDKVSLRVMERFYSSAKFRAMGGPAHDSVRFNSIRDRIATVKASFFEKLFASVFSRFSDMLGEGGSVLRYDTTLVTCSSKLVGWTLSNGTNAGLRKMKVAIGQKGSLPCSVRVFTSREAASDDVAIPEAISSFLPAMESVVVFDRGVQSRGRLGEMAARGQAFVGRLNLPFRHRPGRHNPLPDKPQGSTVTLTGDGWHALSGKRGQWTGREFRVIEGVLDGSGEKVAFVTNIEQLCGYEVAEIYKQRWDIEVLFKFLKQHLNLNHLVVRTDNGIAVMLYMTLIAAILIIAFKKKNGSKSYKIAKLEFSIQLEELIMMEIVTICGGDPMKAKHLWNST